jgi:ElaB/YqjD/DUF883 family membrane-anchored ribosome-binding protein
MNAPPTIAIAGDGRAKHVVGTQFEQLFDDVDDLIKRVADTENPEIRKLRAKVHASMVIARSACEASTNRACRPVPPIDDFGEGPAGQIPGEALGMALLVGVGLGVIMSTQP